MSPTPVPSPFHEVEGFQPARRLLLISPQFPPAGTAGALRWQKLTGIAAERGWQFDVLTLPPEGAEAADSRRLADLPAGTRTWGVPSRTLAVERAERRVFDLVKKLRPSRAAKPSDAVGARGPTVEREETVEPDRIRWTPSEVRDFKRAYWAWLDYAKQGSWADDAFDLAQRIVGEGHEAVITCGPPHMAAHEAGRRLARLRGLPLVMDLRDPWSIRRRFVEYAASPVWFALADRHERRAVEQASLVVTNTPEVCRTMEKIYGSARARFLTVMNGYDDEPVPDPRPTGRFTLTYAGAIYLDRDPRPLFRGVAAVVRELGLGPERLRIEMMGDVAEYLGVPTLELAAREGISDFVSLRSRVPRDEMMRALAEASVLVSLPQDSPWAVPSKLFEYMCFHAWMLVFAEPGTPSDVVLRGSGADVVAPGDARAIADVIRARYLEFAGGVRPRPIASDGRFSRREQARLLLDALESVISARAGGRA